MAQKILIVEDNSDLSQLLALYLSNAGYEISRARNLAEYRGISIEQLFNQEPALYEQYRRLVLEE